MPAQISLNANSFSSFSHALHKLSRNWSLSGAPEQSDWDVRLLETTFCKNFSCCGLVLNDLHDLLHHYEDYHVKLETPSTPPNSPEISNAASGQIQDKGKNTTINEKGSEKITGPKKEKEPALNLPFDDEKLDFYCDESWSWDEFDYYPAAFNTSIIRVPNPGFRSFDKPRSSLCSQKQSTKPNDSGKNLSTSCSPTVLSKKRTFSDSACLPANLAKINTSRKKLPQFISDLPNLDVPTKSIYLPLPSTPPTCTPRNSSGFFFDSDEEIDLKLLVKEPKKGTNTKSKSVLGDSSVSCFGGTREERPYKCQVPGCEKSYKNANGLKYHRRHGHCPSPTANSQIGPKEGIHSPKPYCCTVPNCNKMYKNLNGLKYHFAHSHPTLWDEICRDGVSVGSIPGVKQRNLMSNADIIMNHWECEEKVLNIKEENLALN